MIQSIFLCSRILEETRLPGFRALCCSACAAALRPLLENCWVAPWLLLMGTFCEWFLLHAGSSQPCGTFQTPVPCSVCDCFCASQADTAIFCFRNLGLWVCERRAPVRDGGGHGRGG